MSRWDQKTEGLSRARRDVNPSQHHSKSRSRSRSRSPIELEQERLRKERHLEDGTRQLQNHSEDSSSSADSSNGSNSADASPPAPVTSKVGFSFQKPSTGNLSGTKASTKMQIQMQKGKPSAIQMKLMTAQKKETPKLMKPVANAFAADDSDDEPEEMPAECRMRMRNIGRDTPTSSGPNSFGKTKHGFCDSKKIFEKKLNSLTDG